MHKRHRPFFFFFFFFFTTTTTLVFLHSSFLPPHKHE
jgi:hypothetical protein